MQQLKKSEKLSWLSKISFGMGAFGKDLVYALVGNLFMFYLTDVRFVAPAFVGTLFMAARIWDAFNDPFMGMVVDNTRTRWGKFRPWIAIMGIPAIIVALVFVWLPYETMSYMEKVIAVFICYNLIQCFHPFYQNAYNDLVNVMSPNSHERTDIVAVSSVLYSFAPTIIGLVVPPIQINGRY